MNWFIDILTQPSFLQLIVILSLICTIGLIMGKFKIVGIDLGITFVLFAGIATGHFVEKYDISINQDMLMLAQNFGLILFVYSLGVQVGPGFFTSLKKGGVRLNGMAMLVIISGTALAIGASFLPKENISEIMGVFSGAVTNTPMLGGAQSALLGNYPEETELANKMATACAVAYPFGILATIFAIHILNKRFNKNAKAEKEDDTLNTFISEYQVINPEANGKTIKELMQFLHKHIVITRIWRDGKVTIPESGTVLKTGDHILAVSSKDDVAAIEALFGAQEKKDWNKKDIDWNHIDGSSLISRHILVTKPELNGVKLGSLKLRNNHGINITKINRAGISLLASPEMRLQVGDRLTVVGQEKAVNNVEEILGNEEKVLENPNLASIFIGIALGVILGSIPVFFPGMGTPLKLGVAGGPIIVGILMGAFGSRFHLITYTTRSANLMLRQFGIVVFLACMGLSAGGDFIETACSTEGLSWILISSLLAFIPVLIIGWICLRFFKEPFAQVAGMLSGSMANPIALNFANANTNSEKPAEAYATVYPVSMFVRVISVQIIIILLY